jgi:hypothetical protein
MALDVYFREDILNVLRATYIAGEGPAALVAEVLGDRDLAEVPADKLLQIYRRGFHTALGAVGLAFGLAPLVEQASDRVGRRSVSERACPSRDGGWVQRVEPDEVVDPTPEEVDLVRFLWANKAHDWPER